MENDNNEPQKNLVTDGQEPASDAVSEPVQPVEEQPAQNSGQQPLPPTRPKVRRRILLAGVIILLVAGGICWYLLSRAAKPVHNDVAGSIQKAKKANTEAAPAKVNFTVRKLANGDSVIDKETWFSQPVKLNLADYKFLDVQDPDWMGVEQVGSMSDGTKLVLFTEAGDGGEGGALLMANGSTIKVVESASSDFFYQGKPAETLAPGVVVDLTTRFAELELPQSLQVNGKKFISTNSDKIGLHASLPNKAQYGETDYGTMYKDAHVTSAEGTYETVGYFVQTYDFHWVFYQPEPRLTSINKGTITFSDGDKNDDTYTETFRGCGLGAYEDFLTGSNAAVTLAGQLATGQQLYTLQDLANSEIAKDTLKLYNDQFSDKPLMLDEFLKLRPILLYKNALGTYTALFNERVISGGGCGKPVIYLYPKKPTQVSVKVNATISKSEPAYNGGWNVLAQPDGLLTAGGKSYRSLYWEGFGLDYPQVQDGFIVRQQDVAATIDSNLQQLGLNAQERSDFAAYWLPRLPHTPYLRLTWFGTAQMNKLAPLQITPRPDTLIRVFLDYQGFDKPVPLPVEHLTTIPRKGFTVIEWGSLQ